MIRTRDFVIFSGALVFLLTAISVTLVTDSFGNEGQMASVISFAPPMSLEGAESYEYSEPYADNAARLRAKIAAGEGDVSIGEPVFTSVDDIVANDNATSTITDQTLPASIQIGLTVDGQPLMSNELWRFIGYSQLDQVGIANNGYPIFGARADGAVLDSCGGIDEGTGYRYHLEPGKEINSSCF